MSKDFSTMEDSNRSGNPSIHEVSDPARRTVLRGGAASGLLAMLAPMAPLAGCAGLPPAAFERPARTARPAGPDGPTLGFKGVPIGSGDRLAVPEGYTASVIAAWGEPVGVPGNMPAFKTDASNTAQEQAVQMGMHHDGIEFFPLGAGSTRGLLAMNHEYTDDGLLHVGGMADWTAAKVRKSQMAHGLSVVEVEMKGGAWSMVRPSRFARRVTMDTPFAVGGPAAGHPMMRTAADPAGRRILGTLNNCASSQTPWGTYLSGEENWAGYFKGPAQPSAHEQRWGIRGSGGWYRWHEHDA
ncbi:MAG: PhoX family protein, partial [Rubrivivax sp.]